MWNPQTKRARGRAGRGAGAGLFILYVAAFIGFLTLNIFSPEVMAGTSVPLPGERELNLHGVNLETTYGLILLLGAMLLAMNKAWRRRDDAD